MRTYRSMSEAWVTKLHEVRAYGEFSAPRGMPTRELRWDQFVIEDPLTFPMEVLGREFKDVIAILEATSLVGQFSVPEQFTKRVKKFGDFMDHGVFHGAYGTRVHGRLGDLVTLLERDPDTRQAVLTIYDSRSDLGALKRDVPCTLSLHFMRKGRQLEMRVTMRSNDIWLGTPYDLQQFAILQASIAQALGLEPGVYVHAVGSLHLYDRNIESANAVMSFRSPAAQMGYPLWACEDYIGAISARARNLVLDSSFEPVTEFEQWATRLLRE